MASRSELTEDIIALLKISEPTADVNQKLEEALKKDKDLVNKVHKRTYDSQPLHIAAFTGNVHTVKILLDNGANIDAQTTKGLSPLHRACTAERGPVIRLLLERHAKVDAVDREGRSPLHIVSTMGKEEIMKVLLEWKPDVNAKTNTTKRTALHEAVLAVGQHRGAGGQPRNFNCVELLLKRNPDVNALDSNDNTPLHLAAQRNDQNLVSMLLHAGARLDAKNKDKFTPYELGDRKVKKVIEEIKSDENKAALLESGEVKPKTVKWYICGRSGAGKTTLMRSCCRTFFKSIVTKQKKSDNPLNVDERTPGINVIHAEFGEAGELTAHDLAGQGEYFPAHGLFFNADNTIFSMVVSLEDELEEMFTNVCFWLQYIIASLNQLVRAHRLGERSRRGKPPLSLVMSRADKFQKMKNQASRIGQLLLEDIIKRFDDYFDIHRHVFTLDCQVSTSDGIKLFRMYLKTTKQTLIARQEPVPAVCHSVAKKVLPKLVSKRIMYTSRTDFTQRLRDEVGHQMRDGMTDTIVEYLHKQGQVFSLKKRKNDPQAHTVCTNPNWLCSEVIGTVMAPMTFRQHIYRASDGSVNKAQLADAFPKYKIDDIVQMLQMLEICFQRGSDPNVFQFPCHLADERPRNAWLLDPRMKVYGGRRVECEDKTRTIISPVAFPRFQVRAQTKFQFDAGCMWKKGIKALDMNGCEILVQEDTTAQSIDVVVRGVSGSHKRCSETLTRVTSMIEEILNETSPGTATVKLVLSSSHLSGMSEKPHCYKPEAIEKALQTNGVVFDQSRAISETLYELLVDFSRTITSGLSDEGGVHLAVSEGAAAVLSVTMSNVSDDAAKHVVDRASDVTTAFIDHMGSDRLVAQAGRGTASVVAVSAKNTKP